MRVKKITLTNKNKFNILFAVCIFTFTAAFLFFSSYALAQNHITGRAPQVIIGGKAVLTKVEIRHNVSSEDLPENFKDNRARRAIENRFHVQAWRHNAVRGPINAPVVLFEITDLSCLFCQDLSKAVDAIFEDDQFKNKIRHIVMHIPVDKYNMTNAAAFYSRLAYDAGKFWEYRKKLYDASVNSDNVFIEKLLSVGVEEKDLRRMTRENARRYYRELDADSKAARDMSENKPPVLYVNGIKIGGGIAIKNLKELVDYELKRYEKRQ